jgi:hypothetical protein
LPGLITTDDSTYTDVWFMTDVADAKDSWQGEMDCLRGYPTLSAIRAHATGGGRHALTGYHLKETPVRQSTTLRSFKCGDTALRWIIRSVEALDARLTCLNPAF